MRETENGSILKKKKRDKINPTEFKAAAKDLDLLKTLGQLNVSDDEFGIPIHKIQYSMQQESKKKDPPPRSSVYKGLRRLKSANLVREKVKHIFPEELPQYRGWRVKRNEETKKPKKGENGKIKVQYGFELTPRGEDVVAFIEGHLEPSKPQKNEKTNRETT